MPARKYSIANTNYRYGFNGKENDNDIENSAQDYGMRIYDGRLGRFLSVDPIAKKYPQLSVYQFGSNRPIDGIDQNGLEWTATKDKNGNITGYTWTGGGTMLSCGDNDPLPIITNPSGTVLNAVIPNGDKISLYSFTADSKGELQPKLRIVSKNLDQSAINSASMELGIDPKVINAVQMTESKSGPFQAEGHATILFERHYMYQLTKKYGYNEIYFSNHPRFSNIIQSKPGGYGKYSEQPARLALAKEINSSLAVMSTSWGYYQVMGKYFKLSYLTSEEFENAMNYSASEQFNYFIAFLKVILLLSGR
jgi:RHS repeat-associated protein